MLTSGEPDVGFALAWANQTWTGTWHGAPDRVLKQQTYPGPEDDLAHFESILPAFRDARYLRVHGKPVFYVFRPEELPDASAFVDRWQGMARRAGLDGLYLVAEVSDLLGGGPRYTRADADGFDAAVYMRLPVEITKRTTLEMRARRKVFGGPEVWPYSDSVVDSYPAGPKHPAVRIPELGQHTEGRPTGTRRHRRDAGSIRAQCPRRRSRNLPTVRSRNGCCGSSPGTNGPRATISSLTCGTATAGAKPCDQVSDHDRI